jgi:hypothetical protein
MARRQLTHDDDIVLAFDASQVARHTAMRRANELARELVERAAADAAGRQPDDDGVLPEPPRLRIVLGLDRDSLSARQRRFLHGPVLGQIAEQARPGGQRFDAAVWKEYFRRLFLPDRWESYRLPGAKRATPHRVRVSSEDLSLKGYGEFIEQVIVHAVTELGVEFDLNPSEREAARYRSPPRKRAASGPASGAAAP